MKKLGLVSALSLGLVLLAGCTPAAQKSVTITNSEEMISFYNDAKSVTCVLNYDDGEEKGVSTIYINNSMIKQDTVSLLGEDSLSVYTLARDGQMYIRGDIYGDGVGFNASYELDIEGELSAFDEMDGYTTSITCTKGVKDTSVFAIPTDVEFTSMDEWLDSEYDEGLVELDEEVNEGAIEELVEEVNE